MRKDIARINDAPRKVQSESGRNIGFLPTIKKQIGELVDQVSGIEMRLSKTLDNGEPAAIVGQHIFRTEDQTFAFDYLQDGSSSVVSQYVVRDGVTYDIPIFFPPPGVMLIRAMKVKITQRLYVPGAGPMQVPMYTGDYNLRTLEIYQTKKYSFPDNAASYTAAARQIMRKLSRRMCFVWNLTDTKSGMMFADDLVPDQLLLPQGLGMPGTYQVADDVNTIRISTPIGVTGGYLEFRHPWLFERDGQLSFQFRPIMPVIQPAASDSYAPYPFEDRENSNTLRDSSVTVRIDLHGERYRSVRDAMKMGAQSR